MSIACRLVVYIVGYLLGVVRAFTWMSFSGFITIAMHRYHSVSITFNFGLKITANIPELNKKCYCIIIVNKLPSQQVP